MAEPNQFTNDQLAALQLVTTYLETITQRAAPNIMDNQKELIRHIHGYIHTMVTGFEPDGEQNLWTRCGDYEVGER